MRSTIRRGQLGCTLLGTILGALFLGVDARRVMSAAPSAESGTNELATSLINRAGIRKGVCAVLGSDGTLPVEIARESGLLVHVREPRAGQVARLRKQADAAGLDIHRLTVEQGGLNKLPYADNMIDVVIARRTDDTLKLNEILRVLRPEGTALIGGDKSSLDELRQWAKTGQAQQVETWQDSTGAWVQFSKPVLKGAGDWSHWEHGPDNNPVSEDTVIKAPYMTQFMSTPYYIGMPSITTAAAGRTFLAVGHIAHHRREWDGLNKLIARNGYNGTVLWERRLPEGYLVHRSAFIATKDVFYMIDGDRCLLLDPQTGAEKGEIRIPGVSGHWKWMVMKEGVLYVLAGKKGAGAQTTKGDRSFGGWSWADLSKGYYGKPSVPWGFGETLAAYDLNQKQVLWKHTEKKPIDSRAMSLGNDRVFLYCPGLHLRSLDAKTGKVEWSNNDSKVLDLIEEEGKKLTSTPGFRSACLSVFTPDALIMQGQTRMNVIAISPSDGYLLWTKKKVTNNPNAIFVDGRVVLGVGPGGSHVAVDPITGNVLEDLKFRKRACTRLTACSDSFFVRGEGMLRYDRKTKKVMVDGSARPACNDGALPANGLLYVGPWQCDCNLSLIGRIARCSAGDFKFDHVATEAGRLTKGDGDALTVAPLETTTADWPTFRGNNQRTAGTKVLAPASIAPRWKFTPSQPYQPSPPTSAGDLVFVSGEDGKVRALNAKTGELSWEFATSSPIKAPVTIADGRAYVGSGDGHVYALEAKTGRLLWRFRAAPVERHIMIYGSITSTWPVNSGVLVRDGIAYFAAGIIDYDGTYVYAVDAKTGKIKWQNNSSGHLNPELRKGISAQGNLTIQGNRLLLAGGNQISPAPFDLETGKCLAQPRSQGTPQANGGQFVGVFRNRTPISGGRILYSSPENVSTKGSFIARAGQKTWTLNFGGIAPAWDDNTLAMVNFQHGKLTCVDADKVAERFNKGYGERPKGRRFRANLTQALEVAKEIRWQSNLNQTDKFEAISLAVCPNAIVAVVQYQAAARAQPQWYVVAFNQKNGAPLWRQELRGKPLPGGLLVDRDGQVVVTMLDGDVHCLGAK